MSSMVRLHFLFRSSHTPTRKVDRGPGNDSPAALLCWPWGTARAWSCLPSFCRGVWSDDFESAPRSLLARLPTWVKRVFLAWAIRLLALPLTPLLRRFFCSAELPAFGGLPLPLRFSPLAAWFVILTGDGEERSDAPESFLSGDDESLAVLALGAPEVGLETESTSVLSDFKPPELEPEPNILFSRPP